MLKFIGKRFLLMIPVLLGVLFIVFTMNYISPGDPARMVAGEGATEETIQAYREKMGLDKPFAVRFVDYVGNLVLHGDLGVSYRTGRSVSEEVFDRLPTTGLLALVSMLLGLTLALPIGVISAVKQNSVLDNILMVIALLGLSMPSFWLGIMLIIAFSVKLGWLPGSGFETWRHWILPAITIGTGGALGAVARMTRSSMLEVIRQDYIRTARAKGQRESVVVVRHALKNALIPIITTVGIQMGHLLGGAVLTETIFAVPGIGMYMVQSIKARDYPAVQGGVIVLALVFCMANLVVDIIYAFADPRIKSQYLRKKKGNDKKEQMKAAAQGDEV